MKTVTQVITMKTVLLPETSFWVEISYVVALDSLTVLLTIKCTHTHPHTPTHTHTHTPTPARFRKEKLRSLCLSFYGTVL